MQSNDGVLSALPTDFRLAGRTALVTGSTSGIGAAIARVLAASGARVVVHGRDADRARSVADTIVAAGGSAEVVTGDLSGGHDGVRAIAREAAEALGGRVDVLVNNAGVYPVAPTEVLRDADLDALLSINVAAPHLLVAELAPAMVQHGTGVVVNVGSFTARVGTSSGALYAATKAALEQLTRSWAAEYGPRGVRVNTVAPGVTLTPGNDAMTEVLEEMTRSTVAGRPVRPVDVAYAVRFLASDEAAFVHGTSIDIDGGLTTTRLR